MMNDCSQQLKLDSAARSGFCYRLNTTNIVKFTVTFSSYEVPVEHTACDTFTIYVCDIV